MLLLRIFLSISMLLLDTIEPIDSDSKISGSVTGESIHSAALNQIIQ